MSKAKGAQLEPTKDRDPTLWMNQQSNDEWMLLGPCLSGVHVDQESGGKKKKTRIHPQAENKRKKQKADCFYIPRFVEVTSLSLSMCSYASLSVLLFQILTQTKETQRT